PTSCHHSSNAFRVLALLNRRQCCRTGPCPPSRHLHYRGRSRAVQPSIGRSGSRIDRTVTPAAMRDGRLATVKRLWTWMTAGGLAAMLAGLAAPLGGQALTTRVGQPAPDITGGPWINSEPLTMEKLRGRVVAVEFWTYG